MKSVLVRDPLSLFPRIGDWLEPQGARLLVKSGRVELGQGIDAALIRIAAAETGLPHGAIAALPAATHLSPNEGFTAGSLSITVSGLAVRQAAAALRSLAIATAAEIRGCAADALSIRDGHILQTGEDTGLDLLGLAQGLDLSTLVRETPVIDTPRNGAVPDTRPDLRARIAGAPFLQDIAMDGLLHGRVIHPPNVPAQLIAVDEAALAARPGVVKVVRDGAFLGLLTEVEWHAVRAAEWAAAHVTWQYEDNAPDDVRDALRTSNVPPELSLEEGDAPDAGARRVETTASRPYISHGSIGPSAAIALWQKDRLQVWCHSQGIFPLRNAMAEALGLAPESVEITFVPAAGCYGHNGADDAAMDAALLARAVPGRPVRVQWSRADEFGFAASGAAMVVEAEAFLDADGRIAGMVVRPRSAPHMNRPGSGGHPNLRALSLIEGGSPPPVPRDLPLASGGGSDRNAAPLYALPYRKVEKRLVDTLPYRTSSLRALGGFANVLAIEALMDDVAAATGTDPIALRLSHLDDPRAQAVIRTVAGMTGPRPSGGDGRGWGIGFARYKNTAGYCAVLADVTVDEDVSVNRIWSAVDVGEAISPDGVANQIEGGILQALSWTLKEAVPVAAGRVTAQTWDDYPILRFSEVPPVTVTVLDRPDDPPLGAGEAAAGPTAGALSNAVRHALGVRIPDLPLNREMIARTLLRG